ncbi:hypothetical protein HGRIS_003932 [Hohenbuehelia grisea]|uniref:Uncharacterized protein n=1 Tax=Hohenbuehelia grisea TaxID=104357 RepID=A0ABR3JGZ1_9AGAR
MPSDTTPSITIRFPLHHIFRQLKFIIPGATVTYFLGTLHEFWRVTEQAHGWARTTAFTALGLGFTTISLFIYILLLPLLKGIEPDYRSWRESGVLSKVIPVLTSSIVVGWLLLVEMLGHWTHLGYFKGLIGASCLYALVFGLLGLIPAPKVRRN